MMFRSITHINRVCTYARISSNRFISQHNRRLCSSAEKDTAVQQRRSNDRHDGALTLGKRVAEGTKTAAYTGVIAVGVGLTGIFIYALASDLFGSSSPNVVYSNALALVKANEEVKELLGSSLKGHGETTARGRRRHVAHQEYIVGDTEYMRVRFYVSGNRNDGTVHVEMKKAPKGKWEYNYLVVDTPGGYQVILEDNR